MADGLVTLVVKGKRYEGWKSIRVTRTIEGLAGSFALDVSDRWDGASDPWPIAEGDACRVEIDGEAVIRGFVFKRTQGGDATNRTLSYEGRDAAGDIVDCSVLVPDESSKGNKWTYRDVDIAQFVTAIANQHAIRVSVQPGLLLKKDPILVAHPGETGFEAIKRAVGSASVLVVSDGKGGILITRAGTARAVSLVEGFNIKSGSAEYDASDRFHKYLVASQPPGTDDANAEATRVQAEAIDADVTRTNRVLIIRPDKGYDTAAARARADWEARIRAAKSANVSIVVRGWRQVPDNPNTELWPVNALVHVKAPRLLGIDGEMLISQVEFSVGDAGKITTIKVVRPDAFTPEPQNVPVVSGEGAWKEIATGAL